ncbi:hypothetical protein L1049_013647 [Liquidambar formosana]|uniref:Phytosulfokine n=1 Tax=Liquidambar formosana TaxID=63359 RepID=A0AAP0RLS0_LIQFO
MKLNFHSRALLLLLLFFISSSVTSSRPIAAKQEQEGVKLNEITTGVSIVQMESNDSLDQLMGMENCENEDEECLKRRIVSEAHLDYIYTQHRKP